MLGAAEGCVPTAIPPLDFQQEEKEEEEEEEERGWQACPSPPRPPDLGL